MCKSKEWERHPSIEGSSHFGFKSQSKRMSLSSLTGCSAPQNTVLNTPEGSPGLILNQFGIVAIVKESSAHRAGGKLATEVIIS